MADTVPFTTIVQGVVSPRGVPTLAGGSFVTDGANDPSVTGGIVARVRRLVDGGALPFFRVTLSATFPVADKDCAPILNVVPPAVATRHTAELVTDLITPAPADDRARNEIDIALVNSAGTLVDTADHKICLMLAYSR